MVNDGNERPTGILSGVTILELAGIGPVPFCGTFLADLGAKVIVVERVGAGERPQSPAARLMNRGKRSITLNLRSPEGIALALKLGAQCDAVIEGMRPGVAERLGVGPHQFHAINSRLVYGRMTGWGQSGPLANAAGHDLNYVALSGAAWFAGAAGSAPTPPPTMVGDIGGGALYLTVGVLAALLHAKATGKGQVVDAAIVDGTAHMSNLLLSLGAAGELDETRGSSWIDGSPWYRCYGCADGRWVAVGALEPQFFAELMKKLGLDAEFSSDSQFDKSRWAAMEHRMAQVFSAQPRDAWCQLLEGSDACFAPVLTPSEAASHPHMVERRTYSTHRGFLEAAAAPRFSGFPGAPSGRDSPSPGQHTEETLDQLGVTAETQASLRAAAVI
ncbi:MAG: CoA transferase [Hyphomicrobiales bacterium]|nr:MAG: CoA transferase [Hyphomicrobiales bacterium]